MRIGINGSSLVATGASLGRLVDHAVTAERDGFASYWLGQMAIPDVLTVYAVAGGATSRIELGTAVVPTWMRHPLMLAAQALTTQEACGNRLTLGIGLAHRQIVEHAIKVPFRAPAKHMAEYLAVLGHALADRKVAVRGDIWSGEDDLSTSARSATAPPLLVAAMGPRMLGLAGGQADGTILWLSGPRTISRAISPALRAAATEAGRRAPRIVAGLPICVTDQPERVRAVINGVLSQYGQLPSYRAVLEAEGAQGPGDVAIVGNAQQVRTALAALAEAGATDFAATEFGTSGEEFLATRAVLAEVAAAGV
ncbi:MAG TPA: TIGR03564 family F420-dependent LLM class oxidoreductase [Pseudonocardia sp.]|uniref:TIGR03564 family F420-dependent LLM class oxidoreductase n=1 Tax=Pseudonocardia sp. TaxID=60912 RepID=UPI002CC5DEBC|nr:TIGR03564 family F420-dependent LLM class oxidoreductase [Pseudonocardia sp.]HTF54732.1 TIGR03564 family F420-dependent LLM class oxidoreductase [Pseudonocardia sp.]